MSAPDAKFPVSVVMVDSRGEAHPDWVQIAVESVKSQTVSCELIGVLNRDRARTIGACWNEGIRQATSDWVFFLGDDDYLSRETLQVLLSYTAGLPDSVVCVTSNMTAFEDATGLHTHLARVHTGMWRRSYLLEHPFNEALTSGVDREYIEETIKRGQSYLVIPHYFGYYYRKHEDYSCAGKIKFTRNTADIYALASSPVFLEPIVNRWKSAGRSVHLSTQDFVPELGDAAKLIWCDWANSRAVAAAQYACAAKKILRVHAFEVFHDGIHYVDFDKFDHVIFVADHIREYAERVCGLIKNATVIPNGVDLEKFKPNPYQPVIPNSICYAGWLTNKKGAVLLHMLANEFPEYTFHCAVRFQENDIAQLFTERKPANLTIYPWQYNIEQWYGQFQYVINTSPRESQCMAVMEAMACGCTPLVYNWIGADAIYRNEWIWNNIHDLRMILKCGVWDPNDLRVYIQSRYSFDSTYNRIEELLAWPNVPSQL